MRSVLSVHEKAASFSRVSGRLRRNSSYPQRENLPDFVEIVGTGAIAPAADHHRRVYYYAVLPNLLLSLHPDYMMTHTLWPRALDRTEIVCEWHFHPEAMANPGFRLDDAVSFWDTTNRQDWHVCEQMQLGLKSRAYRPGPYSRREDLLSAFDQLIRSEEE